MDGQNPPMVKTISTVPPSLYHRTFDGFIKSLQQLGDGQAATREVSHFV